MSCLVIRRYFYYYMTLSCKNAIYYCNPKNFLKQWGYTKESELALLPD